MPYNYHIFADTKIQRPAPNNHGRRSYLSLCFVLLGCMLFSYVAGFSQGRIQLAGNGKAKLVISVPPNAAEAHQFAAAELVKYLHQISGATFQLKGLVKEPAIHLEVKTGEPAEAYSIYVKGYDVILSGNTARAVLYAVYDFLERLGCVWLAPDYAVYGGHHEVVPSAPDLIFLLNVPVHAQPAFRYRKIDVDAGRSHNGQSLKKMVDWMAKARYNVLRVPLNLNGTGRVQWDNWRNEVLPELKKRGMLLEVGGHGYQNFINAKMENGTLFKKHPEWFGKDSSCNPSASDRLVFNTTDTGAVNFVTGNIIRYIQQHPEIDIFGLWPSDVGRWQDCKEMEKSGTPPDRQAAFANKVEAAIHRIRPDIVLELIAYSFTLSVPLKVPLSKTLQVDFCPINQSFEKQIYDKSSLTNHEYAEELKKWKRKFKGDVGIYSYYRKYAWRSAPNILPHYMQKDMKWYAGLHIQGISTYAEPGDWFTYEVNHYTLGHISWNPDVNVDSLLAKFCEARYGGAAGVAKSAYNTLEHIVPIFTSIPFTSLKSFTELNTAKKKTVDVMQAIKKAEGLSSDKTVKTNLQLLLLMFRYVQLDLEIQLLKVQARPKEEMIEKIKELVSFMERNLDKGLFILTGDNDLARFTKKYGLTSQSLLD